jgi:hypothetical protein
MGGWGARGACAEVSTGSVEASKARLGFRCHMASKEAPGAHGRIIVHHQAALSSKD